MSNLRRVSTSKLLVLCATVLAVLVVGVAIANAIATSGSPPPRTSLPRAIRGALTAKAPVGISARIKFTSKLVDSSLLGEHASPLLTGATGRLWVAQGGRLRLELQSDRGDTQIVSDGHRFLFSDPSSNTVYTGALPAHRQKREKRAEHKPSLAEIQKGLGRLGRFATVIGPGREVVAGRSAYSVRVEARHNSGLFGGIGAAWDAIRGVPLRFAVYARGVKAPVLELQATGISYGPIAASTFRVSSPAHSRIHRVALGGSGNHRERLHGARHRGAHEVQGLKAVGEALPFHLSAPAELAGLQRTSVHLIADRKGGGAAAIVYGRPLLGGLVVIEHKAGKEAAKDRGLGRNLPHVKIGNVDATELATALGTLVSFHRGGIDYTVVGAVGKAKAEEAARGL
ncbi:MAG: hypothetical protein E6G00_11035 [Actinobacteria bacterium]|nr:MAG: hypothetical protein E6G00_11035 [Actinomycetota bacterium]